MIPFTRTPPAFLRQQSSIRPPSPRRSRLCRAAIFGAGALVTFSMHSIAAPPPGQWAIVLDEGFDGTSLNPNVWTKGYRWNPVINKELQGYVPENVVVANGVCTIKVEKRDCQNVDMNGSKTPSTMHYASGCLQTYTKWTQKYG